MPGIELQVFGGNIELNLRDAERIQIFARRNPRHRLRRRLGNRGHRCFLLRLRLVKSPRFLEFGARKSTRIEV